MSTGPVTVNGYLYKGLLLNFPAIKESVDIINKRHKLNTSKIKISNTIINGARFSDDISHDALLNKTINIWWATPATVSNHPEESLHVFEGVIREYVQGEDVSTLTVEDKSLVVTDKYVPSNKIPIADDSSVWLKEYRGASIPMVYGMVDRCPCVVEGEIDATQNINPLYQDNIAGELKFKADIEELTYVEDKLYFYNGSNDCHIVKQPDHVEFQLDRFLLMRRFIL